MKYEKRAFPRFSAVENLRARVTKDGEKRSKRILVYDISRMGARLKKSGTVLGDKGKIKFEIPDRTNLDIPHTRLWFRPNKEDYENGVGIAFKKPLAGNELALMSFTPGPTGSLSLARTDYDVVNNENQTIRECRGNIFVGVLGALGVWAIGTISLGITNNLDSAKWILIGSLFPFITLSIAIFSTIEKANAINLRKGFLAALAEYLRADIAPPNYTGWNHLSAIFNECISRTNHRPCGRENHECQEKYKDDWEKIVGKHRLVNKILSNFGPFISIVYGCLYILSSFVLFSFLFVYKGPKYITIIFSIIATTFAIGLLFFIIKQIRMIRKGSNSIEAYYFKWKTALKICRPLDREIEKVEDEDDDTGDS